ncbi:MAG: hemolysin family protein [Actinomycetota bacterium]
MSGIDLVLLIGIVLILVVLIVLAIAETGLNRISTVKAQTMAEAEPSRSADALAELVEHPERFINPLLVTVTVLQTAQAFLTTILAGRLFGPWGVAGAFVLNVIVFFVVAESMPKTWAVLHTERAGLATARPVAALIAFPPLRFVSQGLIGLTNVLLPGKGLKQGPYVSEQELLGIVEAAAEDDVIEDEERALIESIIEFGDTIAREVMTPRPDIVSVEADANLSSALDTAIANGFSRLMVTEADDAVGVVHIKDLIGPEREGRGDTRVADVMRDAVFVPETKSTADLMREMQAGAFHLAVVADEYGGVAGIVTLEDCLEELVGEIVDEYDDDEVAVRRLPDGAYLVDGRMPVDDLDDLLGTDLPQEDWDTVGGLVFGTLGRAPERNDTIDVEGWRFTIVRVEGRRITSVRVTPTD